MSNLLQLSVRRPAGHAIIVGPEVQTDEFQTVACCHCQANWRVEPGSGRKRGFCMRCGGPTCGREPCMECVPWEKQIERIEARERFGRQLSRARSR